MEQLTEKLQQSSLESREPSPHNQETGKNLGTNLGTDQNAVGVILAEHSYSHKFSREWVTKSYRSTIVERPERLMAVSIGAAAAQSVCPQRLSLRTTRRLGSLHSPHVRAVHGSKWTARLETLCRESEEKLKNNILEVPQDWNSGDIYLSPQTITALRGAVGAVEAAVDTVYSAEGEKAVFAAVRPPGHHCHSADPSGFCLVNNVHIAIQYARLRHNLTHAVILDIDLHHGDGSQDICWRLAGFTDDEAEEEGKAEGKAGAENGNGKNDGSGESVNKTETKSETVEDSKNDLNATIDMNSATSATISDPKTTEPASIGYFSLHDINSFPTETGFAAPEHIKDASTCIMMQHNLCIWNVHLQPYASEAEFAELYGRKYRVLLDRASEFLAAGQQAKAEELKSLQTARDKARQLCATVGQNSRNAAHHKRDLCLAEERLKAFRPFNALVCISAGFDASEYENPQMQRHGVHVPTEFYTIFAQDARKNLADVFANGRIVSVLEGGYSDAALVSASFAHLVGLTRTPWDPQWGEHRVVKELARGCKQQWHAYKKQTDLVKWTTAVIEAGRRLWPEEAQHSVAQQMASLVIQPSEPFVRELRSRHVPRQQEMMLAADCGNEDTTMLSPKKPENGKHGSGAAGSGFCESGSSEYESDTEMKSPRTPNTPQTPKLMKQKPTKLSVVTPTPTPKLTAVLKDPPFGPSHNSEFQAVSAKAFTAEQTGETAERRLERTAEEQPVPGTETKTKTGTGNTNGTNEPSNNFNTPLVKKLVKIDGTWQVR